MVITPNAIAKSPRKYLFRRALLFNKKKMPKNRLKAKTNRWVKQIGIVNKLRRNNIQREGLGYFNRIAKNKRVSAIPNFNSATG